MLDFLRGRPGWICRLNLYWPGREAALLPRADGLCVLPGASPAPIGRGYPAKRVFVGGDSAPEGGVHVQSDAYAIGAMAADHFLRNGFRSLGVVNPYKRRFGQDRVRGFAETGRAADARVAIEDLSHLPEPSPSLNESRVSAWLRALPKPAGVFVVNDANALEVANVCESSGIEVPHEVALMGVDNDEFYCNFCPVALSSIEGGAYRVGWRAGELLAAWIESGKRPRPAEQLIPPSGVIVRASTDVLGVTDPPLKRALSLIRAQACSGLGVADVVRHSRLNRRALERRFQATLRGSIHREILLTRIDAARGLLTRTDHPVAEIAGQCGFSSPVEFSHVFRRLTGHAPSVFRRVHAVPGLSAGPR